MTKLKIKKTVKVNFGRYQIKPTNRAPKIHANIFSAMEGKSATKSGDNERTNKSTESGKTTVDHVCPISSLTSSSSTILFISATTSNSKPTTNMTFENTENENKQRKLQEQKGQEGKKEKQRV